VIKNSAEVAFWSVWTLTMIVAGFVTGEAN
jgi:hypothetical protein